MEKFNDGHNEVCDLAGEIQDKIIAFIEKANKHDIPCLSRAITTDNHMLLFYEQKTWQIFVEVFDMLGFDFTTGEPDGEFGTWYIDFEFSDGIRD